MRRTIPVASLLLLASCSTPFTSSTDPNAATLRVVNGTHDVHLAGFAFENAEKCSGYLTLPYPNGGKTMPPGTEIQMKVEPERKFSIAFGTSRIVSRNLLHTCGLHVSFRPQAGQRYVMNFQWPADECMISVSRVETVQGKSVLVPEATAEKRTPKTGQLIATESCQ